jgi:hypothetical protein
MISDFGMRIAEYFVFTVNKYAMRHAFCAFRTVTLTA